MNENMREVFPLHAMEVVHGLPDHQAHLKKVGPKTGSHGVASHLRSIYAILAVESMTVGTLPLHTGPKSQV